MENKKQNKKSFEQTAAFEKKLNWDSLGKTNEKKGRRWNFIKLRDEREILQQIWMKFRSVLWKSISEKLIKSQKEMGKFLDTHDLPKLNQQDVNEN